MRRVIVTSALLVACSSPTAPSGIDEEHGDVFGADSRRERYQVESAAIRKAARSSVALIASVDLTRDAATGAYAVPKPQTLAERLDVCDGERFVAQPSVPACSGTLIAPDLVLTAGHCVGPDFCTRIVVVFDFAYDAAAGRTPMRVVENVPADNVYRCKQVVQAVDTVDTDAATGADFGIFRLDRPVTGRAPVAVDWAAAREPGSELIAVGHPEGLPQKIAGSKVVSQLDDFILHEADIFTGSSGSGVFATNGKLVALTSFGGPDDYFFDRRRKCNVPFKCGVHGDCSTTPASYLAPALAGQLGASLRAELGLE